MQVTIASKATPILLTLPNLQEQGGVASFYRSVLPHFHEEQVIPVEIGRTQDSNGLTHPLSDQVRFRKIVKMKKPALIHMNPSLDFKSFIRDGLFAWQARQMGYPFLVFWRGWDKDFERVVDGKFRFFFRATFGRADCSIVLASEFEQKLREWGVATPVYQQTTSVAESLLVGLDVQRKWACPEQLSEFKILFLARLERAKGAFETVKAIKLLIDKQFQVRLTIAGDGKIRQELEEYSRSLNLSAEQIIFCGDVRDDEKIRTFTENHIYCLPSHSEGLPNSVLEAMAFGLPVITRPVGGLADFFEDGKMGALVYGKSPEEIAGCLEKIISSPGKMGEIGRYNAQYAKRQFMASAVAEKLVAIYHSTLGLNP